MNTTDDESSLVEWTMVAHAHRSDSDELVGADSPADVCCGAVRSATVHEPSLWILFGDYALSSFSDRMWMFAVPVLFVERLQRGDDLSSSATSLLLLPSSLYALLSQIACVLFGSAVGAWIDVTDRRRVVTLLLTLQNGCVVAAAMLFAYMTRASSVESGAAWHESSEFWIRLGLLTLLGAVAALASLGQSVAIKKDWVVVLACRDATRLATINAVMRGIDLACDIVAPMVFSIILTSTDASTTLSAVAVWNVVSYFPELFLLLSIYRMSAPLQSRKAPLQAGADDAVAAEAGAALLSSSSAATPDAPAMPSFVERWRIYAAQPVLLSSVSLILLYVTALQPGYLLTSYLKSQHVDDIALASFRGAAAVSGLCSTLVVPFLMSRGVRPETLALGAVSLQFAFLLPTLFTVFASETSPIVFIVCVALSRVALYSFDLSVTQIMQSVPEPVRGVVNAAEGSLTNLASMLGYSLGIFLPDPRDFGKLVCISLLAIFASVVCSAIYWRGANARDHKVRLAKA
jgi:iron-regulated transporter 1